MSRNNVPTEYVEEEDVGESIEEESIEEEDFSESDSDDECNREINKYSTPPMLDVFQILIDHARIYSRNNAPQYVEQSFIEMVRRSMNIYEADLSGERQMSEKTYEEICRKCNFSNSNLHKLHLCVLHKDILDMIDFNRDDFESAVMCPGTETVNIEGVKMFRRYVDLRNNFQNEYPGWFVTNMLDTSEEISPRVYLKHLSALSAIEKELSDMIFAVKKMSE